ncbi:hypothetical protein [Nonomuraea recticatena]|uniref:Uncharacterized protein n=1 Tax=Nonomuraea recticatena TaxID=46178 RepID=A0ABP6FV99_9ACTN
MTDPATWQVCPGDDNPLEVDEGRWQICGWPAPAGEAGVVQPDVLVDVIGVPNGRLVADLIVASVQAIATAARRSGVEVAAVPGGWEHAPDCAACVDVGLVPVLLLKRAWTPCRCRRGRRLLELHVAALTGGDHPDGDAATGAADRPDPPNRGRS